MNDAQANTASLNTGSLTVSGDSNLNGNLIVQGLSTTQAIHAMSSINVDGGGTYGSESSTSPAITNGQTITSQFIRSARLAPTGAVTGIILQAGTHPAIDIFIVNESAAGNTITFAIAGTSNVANGVSTVIAGLTAAHFVWDSVTSLWYHCV